MPRPPVSYNMPVRRSLNRQVPSTIETNIILSSDDDDVPLVSINLHNKKEPSAKRGRFSASEGSQRKRELSFTHTDRFGSTKRARFNDNNPNGILSSGGIKSTASFQLNRSTPDSYFDLECVVEPLEPVQVDRNREISRRLGEIHACLDDFTECSGVQVIDLGKTNAVPPSDELLTRLRAIHEEQVIYNEISAEQPEEDLLTSDLASNQITNFRDTMEPTIKDTSLASGASSTSSSSATSSTAARTAAPTMSKISVKPVALMMEPSLLDDASDVGGAHSGFGFSAPPSSSRGGRGKRSTSARNTAVPSTSTANILPNVPGPAESAKRSNTSKGSAPVVPPPSTSTTGQRNNNLISTALSSVSDKALPNTNSAVSSNSNVETCDDRELAFNKFQGTTFPSLVVIARPHLRVTDLTSNRSVLDSKVKNVLMYPAGKFTEWLIQQGLLKAEQRCKKHTKSFMKLGMCSDPKKYPQSGGYVWTSECCVPEFTDVFTGSLFENCTHPPVTILKLIYHWCCQTLIQNVTQWVKVDNAYVKQIYLWLRAVCIIANHTHLKQLGGPGVTVQVGLISLGTSQNPQQKQIKVEVLGALEVGTKHLRLRAIRPMAENDTNYKNRLNVISEPLIKWIHPGSTIISDLPLDKKRLITNGFPNVIHCLGNKTGPNNNDVMDYLRRVVPRMFRNTLSHLSHEIIQQFLDELTWREVYGTTVLNCFDNMLLHINEITRVQSLWTISTRLNQVCNNPFINWSSEKTQNVLPSTFNNAASMNVVSSHAQYTTAGKLIGDLGRDQPKIAPVPFLMNTSSPNANETINLLGQKVVQKLPPSDEKDPFPLQMVPLEKYYYGVILGTQTLEKTPPTPPLNLNCPYCQVVINDNLALMDHLYKHAHNTKEDAVVCRYCLTILGTSTDLQQHVINHHPEETKIGSLGTSFACLICETVFQNPHVLGKHMSREHFPAELPYICGSCGYRCSSHRFAIDHFYTKHSKGNTIQCPFCLKSTVIVTCGRNVVQNVTYFVQHLQKHQKKSIAKKCEKCTLWFVQKDLLKEHETRHCSLRGRHGILLYPSPRSCIMVPKSKYDKSPDNTSVIDFSTLTYSIGDKDICKECLKPMNAPNHFRWYDNCTNQNCKYITCCAAAMAKHISKDCRYLNTQIPFDPLPYTMYCVCGYSEKNGNLMAKHLACCEKKSAYPSLDDANGATAARSMLDVLGLVRKPDDVAATNSTAEVEIIDSGDDEPVIITNSTGPIEIS